MGSVYVALTNVHVNGNQRDRKVMGLIFGREVRQMRQGYSAIPGSMAFGAQQSTSVMTIPANSALRKAENYVLTTLRGFQYIVILLFLLRMELPYAGLATRISVTRKHFMRSNSMQLQWARKRV